jgi:hypothetical protein
MFSCRYLLDKGLAEILHNQSNDVLTAFDNIANKILHIHESKAIDDTPDEIIASKSEEDGLNLGTM